MRTAAIMATVVAALACVPSALSAPPSNDDFANAAVLAGESGTSDWTNVDATKEPGEPAHAGSPGGASIWFRWVAPRSGQLLVDTCDSSVDTLLAVYTGTAVGALDEVVASDDYCEVRSAVELTVVEGEELRIAVDGKDGVKGQINIWWAMRPQNDDFADAQPFSGWEATIEGSNILATHESAEPLHAGEASAGSVWYRWTAPGSELVQVDTCEGDFDTILAVYRGASLTNLVEVAANDDQCGTGSTVNFSASAGETYYIAVDGFDLTSVGVFVLRLLRARPLALSPPTISGRVWDGETLTGDLGRWAGAPPLSFEFWWEGCGAECYRLPLTNGVRTLRAMALQTVRFVVRATNAYGSTTMHSASVTIPVVPTANVAPPTIYGELLVGEIVTVMSNGEWAGTPPLQFSYQWERCEDRPPRCLNSETGQNADFYKLTQRDVGFRIRVRVIAHGHGGFASAHSAPSGIVLGPRAPQRVSCRVPRLTGKTVRAARRSLARAHCRLGKVARVRSARRRGVIVAQRPKPGTRLRAGGKVTVFVSLGRRR